MEKKGPHNSGVVDGSDDEVKPVSVQRFSAELSRLLDKSEDVRLRHMKQFESRGFLSFSLGLVFIIGGMGLFGWFLLMEGNMVLAAVGLVIGLIPPYFLNLYKMQPLRQYEREYKTRFMPALAKALGGLKFRPTGGVKASLLRKALLLPAHGNYHAEDCFIGTYKGVKLILSEARLSDPKKKGEMAFDGIFVLLELPKRRFKGRTVITGDRSLVKRLKGLQPVPVDDPDLADAFHVFSDVPEEAVQLAGEAILKRLAELSSLFDNASLSVSFYSEKRVFIMIPYDVDMFEPSNLYLPIVSNENALRCKKEIEQILSTIDVLSLYRATGSGEESA